MYAWRSIQKFLIYTITHLEGILGVFKVKLAKMEIAYVFAEICMGMLPAFCVDAMVLG